MERNAYSAGAVKFSFWFIEFKKAVSLLAAGMSMKDLKAKNAAENLFAASSADRAKMVMNTVAKRIESLDPSFVPLFMASDVTGQKLLCLTACMCTDTLFFDFAYEIIRGKLILGIHEYGESDVRAFWANKQVQSEKVASLTEVTLKRLASTYKQYLSEAGVTDNAAGTKKILKPIPSMEIEKWLRGNGLQPVLAALTGE